MSTFNTSRIDNYRIKYTESSDTSGMLYLFEPLQSHSLVIDLHSEQIVKAIHHVFRFYMGGSRPTYEIINSIESYSILDVPKSEVRCYTNGVIEVFYTPIVKNNSLSPNLMQVRFDNIVGGGRRHNEAVKLMRNDFKLEDDIDLHMTMFGVRGCYPYSMTSKRLRVEAFKTNIVALPVLQIPMGTQIHLQDLLKNHLLNDDTILTDLF